MAVGTIYWGIKNDTLYLANNSQSSYNCTNQWVQSDDEEEYAPFSSSIYSKINILNNIQPKHIYIWFNSRTITSLNGLNRIKYDYCTHIYLLFYETNLPNITLDFSSSTFPSSCKIEGLVGAITCNKLILNNLNLTNNVIDYLIGGESIIDELYVNNLITPDITICGKKTYANGLIASRIKFYDGVENLNDILQTLQTSQISDFSYMFSSTHYKVLDLSNFDFSNATNTNRMFINCDDLRIIKCSTDLSSITNSEDMFYHCNNLIGDTGIGYDEEIVDSTRAKLGGYFSASDKPKLIVNYDSDEVVISGNEEYYELGDYAKIIAKPKYDEFYYLQNIIKNQDLPFYKVLYNKDTSKQKEVSFSIDGNTVIDISTALASLWTLSASSNEGYKINGQDNYSEQFHYLQKPALLVELNGLINFDGWYNGATKLSSANPYTFEMPNNNLTLLAKTGGDVFLDQNVRQFALQNGNGEIYKLTDKNSMIFLENPQGLGFQKTITTFRLGNSEKVGTEKYNMPQISGKLLFHRDTTSGKYKDYYDFIRFASKKPITLWYKLPCDDIDNTYYIPVEILKVDKSEVNNNKILQCAISFYGTGFWQFTKTSLSFSQNDIQVYNDGDFNVGIKLTLRKTDETSFSNPKILFRDDNGEYGACAISYDDLTKIEIDTKEQTIILYDGDSVITNPFGYIDFSYANGEKDFPFPKIAQGYTTIKFTYDNDNEDNKVYLVEYDKEYLSV